MNLPHGTRTLPTYSVQRKGKGNFTHIYILHAKSFIICTNALLIRNWMLWKERMTKTRERLAAIWTATARNYLSLQLHTLWHIYRHVPTGLGITQRKCVMSWLYLTQWWMRHQQAALSLEKPCIHPPTQMNTHTTATRCDHPTKQSLREGLSYPCGILARHESFHVWREWAFGALYCRIVSLQLPRRQIRPCLVHSIHRKEPVAVVQLCTNFRASLFFPTPSARSNISLSLICFPAAISACCDALRVFYMVSSPLRSEHRNNSQGAFLVVNSCGRTRQCRKCTGNTWDVDNRCERFCRYCPDDTKHKLFFLFTEHV